MIFSVTLPNHIYSDFVWGVWNTYFRFCCV